MHFTNNLLVGNYVYMLFTYILHTLHDFYMMFTCLTSTFAMDFDAVFFVWFLSTANLINVHENVRSRPSTWMVVAFLPVSGPDAKWDERGGNSMAVRNTELIKMGMASFASQRYADYHVYLFWEQQQAEASALGVPSTPPPDRPRPAPLRLRPLPNRFVADHLRGVRGIRPLTSWDY